MIDISFVRDAYEKNEILNVGFIRTDPNPADAMKKVMHSKVLSRMIINQNKCDVIVDRWVIRL